MGLLDLLGPVLKIAGKALGIGGKVQEVVNALDNAPPEVKAALARDLQQHEQAMKALGIEELKAVMSESIAMIQSPDKFTSRARPFGVYVACLITTALAVAMIFGVKLDTGAIITLIAPLWGQTAWYTYQRTREKMNGHGSNG